MATIWTIPVSMFSEQICALAWQTNGQRFQERTTIHNQVLLNAEVDVQHLWCRADASLAEEWKIITVKLASARVTVEHLRTGLSNGARVTHPTDGVQLLLALDCPPSCFLDFEDCRHRVYRLDIGLTGERTRQLRDGRWPNAPHDIKRTRRI